MIRPLIHPLIVAQASSMTASTSATMPALIFSVSLNSQYIPLLF